MAQDYKHRANKTAYKHQPTNGKKRTPASRVKANSANNQPRVPLWRWSLVLGLLILFAYFLYSLSLTSISNKPTKTAPKQKLKQSKAVKKTLEKQDIQYDFYTILPGAEFVIPDHEVKTRKREERVGKAKLGVQYSVQAGAFRQYKDADSLKAKLIMMGFSPKIEKATIGSTIWHRVKMGPYNQLVSVDAIQSRLKSKQIDALVIEGKK